jgi:hypothetical protein
MNISQVRDKIRGLSNPEGINQYSRGGGAVSKAAEEASHIAKVSGKSANHGDAYLAHNEASVHHESKGNFGRAEYHNRKARVHEIQAERLAKHES